MVKKPAPRFSVVQKQSSQPVPRFSVVQKQLTLPQIRTSIVTSDTISRNNSAIKLNAAKSTAYKQISDVNAEDNPEEIFGFHDPVYDPEAAETKVSETAIKKSTHLQLLNANKLSVRRAPNMGVPYVRHSIYNALKVMPNDIASLQEQKDSFNETSPDNNTFGTMKTFAQPRASFYYPTHLQETKDGMYDSGRNSADFIQASSRRLSYKEYLRQKSDPYHLNAKDAESPLARFRRIVNAIIQARRWNVPIYFGRPEETNTGNSPMDFDLEQFKANNFANCPERAKYTMTLQPWERSDEDVDVIYRIVKRMKAFHSYNYQTKREVSRVITYEKYGNGRIVLQQGHPGKNMYFILKGSVSVQVTTHDAKTGETYKQIVSEIKAGNSFGELALLKDICRTATVVCKGDTELLALSKDDFDMVIRVSMEKEWNARMEVLKNIEYFKSWPMEQLKILNVRAKMIKINMNKVVLGNVTEIPDVSYFVASGRCLIVRKVNMLEFSRQIGKYNQKKELTYKLIPTDRPKSKSKRHRYEYRDTTRKSMRFRSTVGHNETYYRHNDHSKKVSKFLVCGVITSGESFGFGEDLTNIHIITATSTKFITIPAHVLMTEERHVVEKRRHSNLDDMNSSTKGLIDTLEVCSEHFKELKMKIERKIPTEQMTFDSWMTAKRWNTYKQEIMLDIVESRNGK